MVHYTLRGLEIYVKIIRKVSKQVWRIIIGVIGFVSVLDIKRLHSTGGFENYIYGETSKFYQPDYYTNKALQKYGY